jgi:hypothetical protein
MTERANVISGLVLSVFGLCLGATAPVWAQQYDSSSLQRVRVALESPPAPWLGATSFGEQLPKGIGMLTLQTPELPGEIVRVSLPIGDLVTRAIRGVGAANRRRAERKAGEEVQRVMSKFQAQSQR